MIERAAHAGFLLSIVLTGACGSDQPSLERRGPDPSGPVMDGAAGREEQGDGGDGGPGVGGSSGQSVAEGGAGSRPAELVPFCEALTVVREKCQRCHGAPLQHGAPVPFVAYDDFQAFYLEETMKRWWQRAEEVVAIDFMPYVDLNNPPTSLMPPVQPLTSAEKATLMTWFEQGALPEGGTNCP